MDPSGLIFVIILLAVSGFVAWAGDTVGRVMGKRRITLFGMRPKRTSILIAILTGMLITGGTILTLAIASEDVRAMLSRITTIRQNIRELEDENASLTDDNETLRLAQDVLQSHNYQLSETNTNLTWQLTTAQSELINTNEKVEDLYNDLVGLTTELDTLNSEIESLNSDVDELDTEVGSLQVERQSLQDQIIEKEELLASLNGRIEELNLEILELSGQVAAFEFGEQKVLEGQQLGAVLVDPAITRGAIEAHIARWLDNIPITYRDPETGTFILMDNEITISLDSLSDAVDSIQRVTSDQAIVVAYSTSNVVEDQPVPVRLDVSYNRRIFIEGSLMFSQVYDAPASGTDPMRATLAQFFSAARDYLINEKDIVPTTAGDVLQLTYDDLSELSARLDEMEFPVELRMVALKDLTRPDFLVYGDAFTVTILPESPGPEVSDEGNSTDPE